METEPQQEHKWLQQFVGEWTFENESVMGPGQPPMKMTGSESTRSLGGLWILCEGSGDTPGGTPMTSIITIGYDPAKKRFVGSFIASVMANLWIYDGSLDGNVLTLGADGPSFTEPGKVVKYQDIFEIKGPDHRVLSSQYLGDDGAWHGFMTATYRRKK